MKTCFLLLLFIVNGLTIHAQQHEYCFRAGGIDSYPAAKPLISILRGQYNTETSPKSIRVAFDPASKEFHVFSETLLTEPELQDLLADYSYVMTDFRLINQPVKPKEDE